MSAPLGDILENIARLLEIKGENPFKIRAYTNAARALETYSGDLEEDAKNGRLTEVDGIGKAIAEKITTWLELGHLPYYDELRAEFPPGLLDLFELQGLGGKKIKVLWDQLKVASIDDLAAACRDGRVSALSGFGQKTADNLLKAVEQREASSGLFLFGDIVPLAEAILEDLRAHPAVGRAEIAGSYRRKKEIVRDLDFIVSTKKAEEVGNFFVQHRLVRQILAHGATKSSVLLDSGLQCDLRVVNRAEFAFALNYFTGSKEHNIRMRNRALDAGWSLNEYRFSPAREDNTTPPPDCEDEPGIYRALGLDYIPPELREDRGEIDAAAEGRLPDLIEWTNLRGTFHNHTTASDGRNSLEEMADAAAELGLEYLGIADHSKSSFQANGLDARRLALQVEQINHLNQSRSDIRLLSGTECDILKDGSLDFPDDVLAGLDYVVASVHSSFTLGEKEMTKRLIKAMENPHVTMLGHPTGRLLLSRESYAVNLPAVIDAAAATGTIIELNASRYRLELDWRWWPLALEKGVRCAINPDAHSTDGLQDLRLGVHIARKGWLTRRDVINCLPLDELLPILKKKRS